MILIGRLLYCASQTVVYPLWLAADRLLFRGGTAAVVRDIQVTCPGAADHAALVDKSAAALDLIAVLDPVRLERIRRLVRRVIITDLPGARGAYIFGSRTCLLSADHVRERSAALVALTIVHEAAHVRVDSAGIRFWPDLKARIERRCDREQLAFAQLLEKAQYPNAGEWVRVLARRTATTSP